jgi:hypothetical protein
MCHCAASEGVFAVGMRQTMNGECGNCGEQLRREAVREAKEDRPFRLGQEARAWQRLHSLQ